MIATITTHPNKQCDSIVSLLMYACEHFTRLCLVVLVLNALSVKMDGCMFT